MPTASLSLLESRSVMNHLHLVSPKSMEGVNNQLNFLLLLENQEPLYTLSTFKQLVFLRRSLLPTTRKLKLQGLGVKENVSSF